MVHAGLGTTVPDAAPGAPPWIVALVLVALTIAAIMGYNRLNRPETDGEPVQPRRSRRYRRYLEAEAAAAAAADGTADPVGPDADPAMDALPPPTGAPVTYPTVVAAPTPTPSPAAPTTDDPELQGRLAQLDLALSTGNLGADEHRVLRAALLEDAAGTWTRPTPVQPPTE